MIIGSPQQFILAQKRAEESKYKRPEHKFDFPTNGHLARVLSLWKGKVYIEADLLGVPCRPQNFYVQVLKGDLIRSLRNPVYITERCFFRIHSLHEIAQTVFLAGETWEK